MTHRRSRRRRWTSLTVLLGTAFLVSCSTPHNKQNSLRPKGPAAHKIDNLFTPIFYIAVGVGIFVFAMLLIGAWRFRYRPGKNENPKQVHGNMPLEIGWTVAPAVILAVVAVFTINTIFDLAKKPSGKTLDVTAIGKQWWWEFKYNDQKVVTADELVVPAGTQVRVHLSACDPSLPNKCNVIHSFWVPELAGKTDVVPGRDNATTIKADKPGTYLGQCAEYCGLSHANMKFRVIAKSQGDFDQWVSAQQQGPAVAFQQGTGTNAKPAGPGQQLVQKYQCTNCHSLDNSKLSTYGPNLTHLAGRTTFASGYYELNRKNLTDWIFDAPSLIPMESQKCREPGAPAAVKCVGMPSFSKNTPAGQPTITRQEAQQIADYLLQLK